MTTDNGKIALVMGITGQDGSYLAEQLLQRGYSVHGIIRRASTFNTSRIDHIYKDPHDPKAKLFLHYGDMTDASSIWRIVDSVEPDEIYNLGAQSHVRVSFDIPEYTADVVAMGTVRILEAARRAKRQVKFYQASSSELFGSSPPPQNEETPFHPRSPYACAKAYAYYIVQNYRESYGMFASNGILFNHESPRRGETFVTRKVTMGVAKILAKKADSLYLGNLDARRDWGYAPEYTECMQKILAHKKADDFVVATGETHSVREFVQECFSLAGLDWQKYVKIDKRYFRPAEVEILCGTPTKAAKELGWKPKITFKQLAKIMLDADMKREGLSGLIK